MADRCMTAIAYKAPIEGGRYQISITQNSNLQAGLCREGRFLLAKQGLAWL